MDSNIDKNYWSTAFTNLIMACEPKEDFYDYIIEIMMRCKEFELAGICIIALMIHNNQYLYTRLLQRFMLFRYRLKPATVKVIEKMQKFLKDNFNVEITGPTAERLYEDNDVYAIVNSFI